MKIKKLTKKYCCKLTVTMDTAYQKNRKVNQNIKNRQKMQFWLTLVNFLFSTSAYPSPQKKRNTDLTAFLSMGNYPRLLELPQ
jgi:hypothetical protein